MISSPGEYVSPERHFYLHMIDTVIDCGMKSIRGGDEYFDVYEYDLNSTSSLQWAKVYAQHFNVTA